MYTRREAIGTMGKLVLVASTVSATDLFAKKINFRSVEPSKAQIIQEGKSKMFCPVCGMTLAMFYKTNNAADVKGKTHQYCSIHCMHEEAMLNGEAITNPRVVDNESLKFVDANNAYYVVGSKKPATMSTVSKYAFASKSKAEAFSSEFGGKVMSYAAVSALVSKRFEKRYRYD